MPKLYSYAIENNGTFTRIEGDFLGVSGTNLVFTSDDPSSPWVVNPTEAYLSEKERDAAIARGENLLSSLTPSKASKAPKAQPVASKAPKASKAQPVAVKVTSKAKKKTA